MEIADYNSYNFTTHGTGVTLSLGFLFFHCLYIQRYEECIIYNTEHIIVHLHLKEKRSLVSKYSMVSVGILVRCIKTMVAISTVYTHTVIPGVHDYRSTQLPAHSIVHFAVMTSQPVNCDVISTNHGPRQCTTYTHTHTCTHNLRKALLLSPA